MLFAFAGSRRQPERGTTMCQILIAPDRLEHSPRIRSGEYPGGRPDRRPGHQAHLRGFRTEGKTHREETPERSSNAPFFASSTVSDKKS